MITAAPVTEPIAESAWAAVKDKPVVVERSDGTTVRGKLVAHEGTHAVVVQNDGNVVSLAKADVKVLKSDDGKAPADKPPTTPPPEEKPKPTWKYKQLGLFTSHGVAYTRWRGSAYRDGSASYMLDVGVGYNFSQRFGVYALIGGSVGARLVGGAVKANFGHFALSFQFRRKYVAIIPGIGLALSGRRGPGDEFLKETGVAIPVKFMGMIPLPKDLFLGLGLGYDLAIMADARLLNSIGFQITVGRW